MPYLYLFLVPLLIALLATPLLYRFAHNNGMVDLPGTHKLNTEARPVLGGIGIYLAWITGVLAFFPLCYGVGAIIMAAKILVIAGVLDDLYNLKVLQKLLAQSAAALIAVLGNVGHFRILLDYFNQYYIPDIVTLALITGWIVLMINAFNLIDGLDGLAGGTAAIILISMAVISITLGRLMMLGFLLPVLGAVLGFLPYNFQPARILMGDTGSMLLGFMLSMLFLLTIDKPFSISLVLGSAFIFAYPALDIFFAVYRRLRRGSSIFQADRGHIHHLLLQLGYSVRQTVAILYAVSALSGTASVLFLCVALTSEAILAAGLLSTMVVFFFFRYLNGLTGRPRRIAPRGTAVWWPFFRDRPLSNGK